MANPTLLTMPLCRDADKNTIPATDAGTAGIFSEQYGWQAVNSLPLSAGGKAVQRQDFNGVFALLGGIAYACQRGYTFEWDSTQDYVVGCVVLDTNDNKRYECISDVTANATPPNADTTHWQLQQFGLDREVIPAFNTRDIITTSGTYTAPVTGWYKITAKGGGGGGGGSTSSSSNGHISGAGGGEGGTTIAYVSMTAGDTATVVIGGGGAGGVADASGVAGGNTSVTYNGNTYTAYGGSAGTNSSALTSGGAGGDGTIKGINGEGGFMSYTIPVAGRSGGGAGGGIGVMSQDGGAGVKGGGGAGGGSSNSGQAGGTGGDGFVWFEYFATI